MTNIQTTTLPSGLRVVTDHVPSVESVALGIWAGVGTRDEDMAHNGAAHMVEHMLFKGTEKRNAQQIVEVIEDVGGNMNAYTSREVTSYHIHLLKDDVPLALDVLADMYQNSTMPDDEIERERQVILQEIGMCHDTPDDLVFDNYYEAAYPGQALGAPILGTAKIISSMSRAALEKYVSKFYTPSRTVISAAGNIDHEAFASQVGEVFTNLPEENDYMRASANYGAGEDRSVKDLEQTHLILGFQGTSRLDEDYYTAQALSTLLGGGMSSRLFQEVREKRGLVYSIFAFCSAYLDDGQFGIYAGTGPEKLEEIIPVICDEVQKLSSTLTEEEIMRAKSQLKANLLMGRESMMSRADQQAKYLLFREKALDVSDLVAQIEAVDQSALQRTAEKIFSTKPTLAALGPLDKLESYDRIEERLAA